MNQELDYHKIIQKFDMQTRAFPSEKKKETKEKEIGYLSIMDYI